MRGITCHYKHEGFLTTEDRCSNCGTKGHIYRVCTAPGGGADPDWQKNKDDYDARRAKAAKDLEGPKGPAKGSGKDKPGTGKGK